MTLDGSIKSEKLRDQDVADAIGVSRSFVTNLRSGKRKPSITVAAKIESWSKGVVSAASFATPVEVRA